MPADLPTYVHLYRWLTISGYAVRVDGEIVTTESQYIDAVVDADFVRVYAFDRASDGTPAARVVAWFDCMNPTDGNCAPDESVVDYSVSIDQSRIGQRAPGSCFVPTRITTTRTPTSTWSAVISRRRSAAAP